MAAGRPNDASKRLVQRWEFGTSRTCRPVYARGLEAVAGLPIEALGFSTRISSDGRGGHDLGGVLHRGDRLTVPSLPQGADSSGSALTMALEVDRNIATGTWREETAPGGYYQGAVYHGAIQLLVEPTGRRMAGKWVGFGKEFDVNTGPWELVFQDSSTSQATLDAYSRPPS